MAKLIKSKEGSDQLNPSQKFPTKASDYGFVGQIGKGAFAAVFLAECIPHNRRKVAIKVIELEKELETEEDHDKDKDFSMDEIQKEASVLIRMQHINCVQCYVSFTVQTELWLVMPYLAGGSCADIMKSVPSFNRGFKDESILATILRDVVSGIEYCHQDGRVHRDIKAANILLSDDGIAKVSDFGVSGAIIEGGLRKNGRHTFTGSLWWMSPEVLQKENRHSFPADIWSLGITALELAFGAPPHSTQRPVKVMLTILQSPPPSIDSFDKEQHPEKFSKGFRNFVQKCLQKDPAKRASAKELLSDKFLKQAIANPASSRKYIVDNVVKKAPQMQPKAANFQLLPKSVQMMARNPDQPKNDYQSASFDFRVSMGNLSDANIEVTKEEPKQKGRFLVE